MDPRERQPPPNGKSSATTPSLSSLPPNHILPGLSTKYELHHPPPPTTQFPQSRLSIDFDSMLISLPPPFPNSPRATLVSSPGAAAISKASPPFSFVDSTFISSLLNKKGATDDVDQRERPQQLQQPQPQPQSQSQSQSQQRSSPPPVISSNSAQAAKHNDSNSPSPSPPATVPPSLAAITSSNNNTPSSNASNATPPTATTTTTTSARPSSSSPGAPGPIYAYQRTKIRRRRAAWQIERPFRCEEQKGCDKTYGSASALRTHVKKKHPDRLFHFDAKNFAWLAAGNKNTSSPSSSVSSSSSSSPPLLSHSSSATSTTSLLSPIKHSSTPVDGISSGVSSTQRSASFPPDFGINASSASLLPKQSLPYPAPLEQSGVLPGSPPKHPIQLNSMLSPQEQFLKQQQQLLLGAGLPFNFFPSVGQPPPPPPTAATQMHLLNQLYLAGASGLPAPYVPPVAPALSPSSLGAAMGLSAAGLFPQDLASATPLAAILPTLQYPFRQFEADDGQPLFLHCDHFALIEFNNAKQEIDHFKWHFKGIDGTSIVEVQVPYSLVNKITVEYGVALVKLQFEYASSLPPKLIVANNDSSIFEKYSTVPKKLLLNRVLESKRHTLYFSRSIFSEFIYAVHRDVRTKSLMTISKPNPLL